MTTVHVQSTRRLDLAFCGAALQGPGLFSVHLGHLDESALARLDLFGVDVSRSPDRLSSRSLGSRDVTGHRVGVPRVVVDARSSTRKPLRGGVSLVAYVTADQARGLVGRDRSAVPLHSACVLNFGKFLGKYTGRPDVVGDWLVGEAMTDPEDE